MTDTTHEAAQRLIAEATHEAWDVEVVDLIGTLLAERDDDRAEIERLRAALHLISYAEVEARVAAARREGIEAAAAIAANWNIPSVDKPRHILALLTEPSHD